MTSEKYTAVEDFKVSNKPDGWGFYTVEWTSRNYIRTNHPQTGAIRWIDMGSVKNLVEHKFCYKLTHFSEPYPFRGCNRIRIDLEQVDNNIMQRIRPAYLLHLTGYFDKYEQMPTLQQLAFKKLSYEETNEFIDTCYPVYSQLSKPVFRRTLPKDLNDSYWKSYFKPNYKIKRLNAKEDKKNPKKIKKNQFV